MTYDAFWLAYLREHRRAGTRMCHYVGTTLGLGGAAALAAAGHFLPSAACALAGYAVALTGHFLVEGNRPYATKPIWGLYADFRMLKRAVTGQLANDLERACRNA